MIRSSSTLYPVSYFSRCFLQRHCFRLSCRFPPVFFWQLNSDSLKMVDCYSRLARNYVQHCVPYESNSYRPSWSSYSFELSTSSQTAKTHHLNPISFSDVNLYLNWTVPPLSVAIVVGERNPAAGRPFSLPCHVTGSRPTPKITWWRNDVLLDPSTHNQVRSSQ